MNNNKYYENFKLLIPGYLQGITRVCISYPFDYFRLKMQTNQEKSIKNTIKNNYKTSYRGLFIPLIFVPIDRGISFALYEHIKKNNSSPFISSIIPSIVSNIYMTPINSLNANYIYHNKTKFNTLVKSFFNKNTYNGFSIEVFRNSLSSFLFLYSYDFCSKYSNNSFINGTLASLTMWSITYPLDTIKANRFIFKKQKYFDILKTTNFKLLYKGIGLIYLRAIPSAGGGMFIYERSKEYFIKVN